MKEIKGAPLGERIFAEYCRAGIVIRKAATVKAWVDWAVDTYGPSMAFGLTKAMIRKALGARVPAAWCVWATSGGLGLWLTDGEFEAIKRLQMASNRRSIRGLVPPIGQLPNDRRQLEPYEFVRELRASRRLG